MNERRALPVLQGVTSLIATFALISGVPVLLAALVGWPLPTSIPSLSAIEQAARSGISDQVVVKLLAVIAWLAWSQLALALALEGVAVAQRRQATRIPVLPGFQIIAAHLVAGILMMASTVQPARADAARQPVPLVAQTTAATDASTAHFVAPGLNGSALTFNADTPPPATTPSAIDHQTVTVQRHDSYWAIADRTLGDGLRWRELLDLNLGRTLPDGTVIADDTLHTGWVLRLPADANGDPIMAAPSADTETPAAVDRDLSTVVVVRGDNLWTISEDRLAVDLGRAPVDPEVAPYWHAVIDANRDRYVQPENPNLILPGQVLVLPPTGTPHQVPAPVEQGPAPAGTPPAPNGQPAPEQPVAPPVTSTTTASSESKTPPRSVEEPTSTPTHADQARARGAGGGVITPIGAALGGLSSVALAVGLKRLLDRRRRRFLEDHDGRSPGRTPPDLRHVHHAVIVQADDARIDDLQGALGLLAASLATTASARRPRIIRHSSDGFEVLLDQPDPSPPAGWTSTEDGTVWTRDQPTDPGDPFDGPVSVAPLMVTIGEPEHDAQLYLDLETDSLLALSGDPAVATNLARSIITELTLSALAETLRVIAVGDVVGAESKVLEHLTVADSWEDVIADVHAWAGESHGALVENDWPNAFVARAHEPDHDALVPLAVIADRPPPPELIDVLRCSWPSTVAVVVVGAFDGAVNTIRCETDTLNFDTIELACTPREVPANELADMCRLLVATDNPDDQQLMDESCAAHEAIFPSNGSDPRPESEHLADDNVTAPDSNEPPGYDILVRLLGDITVEGGTALKPKATAVVAYLAVHRSVTTERLEEACWFGSDGMSHRKRLRDVMTESRDALGSQHFPANRGGIYVAGPRVRTDLELFEWHVQRAAQLEPSAAVEHYHAALDLITGKPFSYPNAARASFGWVDFEHHSTEWEYRIARVAQACAEAHLDIGEAGEAIALLRRIIHAVPLNSGVVETLMRAHITDDDRAGAQSVYQEYAAAIQQAGLGDPDDAIQQLYVDLQSLRNTSPRDA